MKKVVITTDPLEPFDGATVCRLMEATLVGVRLPSGEPIIHWREVAGCVMPHDTWTHYADVAIAQVRQQLIHLAERS